MTAATEAPPPPLEPVESLWLAIWIGMSSGFLQVLATVLGVVLLHQVVSAGPHLLWMAPLATSLVLLLPAALLALIALARPRWLTLPRAAWCLLTLGYLNLTLFIPGMNALGCTLLAAGLATVTTRTLAPWPGGFGRRIRPLALGLTVAAAVGAMGVFAWTGVQERLAIARTPAAGPGLPNVLLLVLDTVRADNLSVYGYSRPTSPTFERLAQQGVRFRRVVAAAPWTLPSHASMFTGRWPHQLSAGWRTPLDATYPTLAEALRGRGYLTGGFIANLQYCISYYGLARGFTHYEDFLVSPGELLVSSKLARDIVNLRRTRRLLGYYGVFGHKSAETVADQFLHWQSRQAGRPFFAFLNFMDAHEPYLPPPQWEQRFVSSNTPRRNYLIRHFIHQGERVGKEKMPPAEVRRQIDAYDGGIAYIDDQIGWVLGELERRGVLEHTLVIVTSDHGEQFGEHGLFDHGNSLYRPPLQVPLILVWPGHVPAGLVPPASVSLRDIPATVMDLIGAPNAGGFEGTPLARQWDGSAPPATAEPLFSALRLENGRELTALTVGSMHYIRTPGQHDRLYDWTVDSAEAHSLITTPEGQARLPALRAALDSILSLHPVTTQR